MCCNLVAVVTDHGWEAVRREFAQLQKGLRERAEVVEGGV